MQDGTIGGFVFLMALLVALGKTPPAAAIDLSGDYVVPDPSPCRLTEAQTGTALQMSGTCTVSPPADYGCPVDLLSYQFSLTGTVDPVTGAFSATGQIAGLGADFACTGMGDGEEMHGTCTSSASVFDGTFSATKCGNGVIDPLESCDPSSEGGAECCSAHCRLAQAGTACASDGNDCTDDVCNAGGTCTHVPLPPAVCRRCNGTCRRDIARCMATECEGVGPEACRRRCKPAPIRTLAYALSECREDAGQSFVGRQQLRIRQGDREPITVAEFGPSNAIPDPVGFCRAYAGTGFGTESVLMFPLQRLGVSPDGSAVVFEVNDQSPFFHSIALRPEENGIFFVRADGSQPPRRLGPPSRDPSFRVPPGFGQVPLRPGEDVGYLNEVTTFSPPIAFSPNGRRIAFTDLGPGPAGEETVQIVVLDLVTGERTLATRLPAGTAPNNYRGAAPFLLTCCPRFIDDGTVLFQTFTDPVIDSVHLNPEHDFAVFTVRIDGSGLKAVPKPAIPTDSHVVPTFGVFGPGTNLIRVAVPEKNTGRFFPCQSFPVTEIFLEGGKKLLQLTKFGRLDTFAGFVDARRRRAFFVGSADPLKTNPHESCQIFSIDTVGRGLRQITHFDLGYFVHLPGCFLSAGGVGYGYYRTISQDAVTKAVIFNTAQDPLHLGARRADPTVYSYSDDQIFAVRPDGTGLRQLTDAAGFTTGPDGSIRVELPGPFAYPAALH